MTTTAPDRTSNLKLKMETREARIGIVGMGYVGLPLALLFSSERFRVTGFDIAQDKVNILNAGGSYIVRILPDAIQAAQQAGFRATSDYSRIAEMDASSSASPPRSTTTTSPTSATSSAPSSPSPPIFMMASSSSSKAPPTPAPPRRSFLLF